VAVALVLLRHAGGVPVLSRIGWVGVDLFFVLSGFLISGLFYSEFQRRGAIRLRRFFIRRGLKIYPSFYAMILGTLIACKVLSVHVALGSALAEVFFVQNYHVALWPHTWSLGVEEHFYIFLPIFFLILIRRTSDKQNPFRIVPAAFAVVAVVCLLSRIITMYFARGNEHAVQMVINPTHNRMDSLFCGVTLAYLFHFRPGALAQWFDSRAKQMGIVLVAAALLSCCLLDLRGFFLPTIGLSFLYLGFGALLLLSLYVRDVLPAWLAKPAGALGTACAFIGAYSYSIYLWHIPFQAYAAGVLRRVFGIHFGPAGRFCFVLIGTVAFGILMGKLIEFPVLRFRDNLFPPSGTPSARIGVAEELTPVATGVSGRG
jgi:peptidoglycan/LPS O-acetylase OafA/YrhL